MTTNHFMERARTRLGLNKKRAKKLSKWVMKQDKASRTNCKVREQKWINRKSRTGCKAIVFQGNCFIVSTDNIFITVYPLPFWYGKRTHYDHKKSPIRKTKRYAKMNAWESNYYAFIDEGFN